MSGAIDRIRRATGLRKELFSRQNVLDIGCGDRKRGSVGVDISPTGSADIQADGTALPFQADAFSGVVCYHVIEHLQRPAVQSLLGEINRVSKPNGRVYLLIDRDVSESALFDKNPTHEERYAPTELYELVASQFDIDIFQTHNLVGNILNYQLDWWRYLGAQTKVYIEAEPV